MKNIFTVMRKEFARFFGDKRMIVSLILPAVLIYVIYSFMGSALSDMFAPDADYVPTVYAANIPDSISAMVSMTGLEVSRIEEGEAAGIKEKITLKEADLCMVFPKDFETQIASYDPQTSAGFAPNIELYYNSTDPNSSDAYMRVYTMLDMFEASLANKFDVNREVETADLATTEDVTASIISMMLPMLLMLFLFTGCMSLALESITGEKERGTIATLLVTPLKRSELAIGKILSLAVLSFLAGSIMAVATIASLPNLMGGTEEKLDAGIYGITEYAFLALIILTTLLLMVTIISIISAFAKTVKEASSSVMPVMIVVMLVGVSGMFGNIQTDVVYYLIPLYNSVQGMGGIFSLDYSAVNIAVSCLSNLAYACVGGFVLTKMFNSEKIMFSR